MRRAARLGALLLLLISLPVFSAISFPELTGRVVDNADMIDAATEQQLTQMLAAHEQNSTNQVVVVTVNDLQGTTIEDFGYQLGRTWGIGQKNADNGALLLVAKDERKVRIEVGYGLEGVLTDAISANIIHAVILPKFKQAQFNDGIKEGAQAILAALGNDYQMRETSRDEERDSVILIVIFIAIFVVLPFLLLVMDATGGRRGGFIGGGGFGGGGLGGGFGGGGGGFGGGGASGGW
jgi:uncharacterized protein